MASFSQLIGRLKAEQQLGRNLDRANLGIDVTDEKWQLEEARAEYRRDVEEAQRQMQANAAKRSRRGMLGNILGTVIGYAIGGPAGAKLLGSAIGGGAGSYLGRESVSPYKTTFTTDLLPGKFLTTARKNLDMDLTSSTNFVSDLADQQRTQNFTNSLGDAINTYTLLSSLGVGTPTPESGKTETKKSEESISTQPQVQVSDLIQDSLLDTSNILGGSQSSTYGYQVDGPDGFTLTAPLVDPFDIMTDDEGELDLFGGALDAEYINRIYGNDRRNY